jgi:hypothetical protein
MEQKIKALMYISGEIQTSFINWAYLTRLLPEDEDRIQSLKVVLNNTRKMYICAKDQLFNAYFIFILEYQ